MATSCPIVPDAGDIERLCPTATSSALEAINVSYGVVGSVSATYSVQSPVGVVQPISRTVAIEVSVVAVKLLKFRICAPF